MLVNIYILLCLRSLVLSKLLLRDYLSVHNIMWLFMKPCTALLSLTDTVTEMHATWIGAVSLVSTVSELCTTPFVDSCSSSVCACVLIIIKQHSSNPVNWAAARWKCSTLIIFVIFIRALNVHPNSTVYSLLRSERTLIASSLSSLSYHVLVYLLELNLFHLVSVLFLLWYHFSLQIVSSFKCVLKS